jgi:hypothetical protein
MILVFLNGRLQEFLTKEELLEFVHTTVDQIFDGNQDIETFLIERDDKWSMNAKLKGLLKSKVFWVNALTIGAAIVNEYSGKLIPTQHAVEIIAGINLALRFVTNKPLDQK